MLDRLSGHRISSSAIVRVLATIAAVVMVATLTGCSDDNSASSTTDSTPVSSTSSSSTTAAPSTASSSTTSEPSSTSTTPSTTTPGTTASGTARPIPNVPAEYADELVRAWGAGRSAQVEELTRDEALRTLEEHSAKVAKDWTRTLCEGAAGSSYCSYESPTMGRMTVRVGNEAASKAEPHAVTSVKFGSNTGS